MKKLIGLFLIQILVYGCTEKPKEKDTNASGKTNNALKTIYSDVSKSSIEVTEKYSRATEVTYSHLSLWNGDWRPYIAKITTTTNKYLGGMTLDRTIKAELNSLEQPERPKIVIEESCHEINFFEDYYETVKWGCCGAENQLEFYDYDKKLIIEGTSTITKCRIPNSHLRFFASIDGGIRLSFSSSDQYLIQIISPPNFQDENCGPIPPDIIFESADSKDKYDQTNNEYEFWSLNGVKEKERINNLTIKVKWTCADVSEPIMIPIINGKPFGKDERVQSVSLRLR